MSHHPHSMHNIELNVFADGLKAPEGPVHLADGSLLVCEMAAGRITRLLPDGAQQVVAETGGTPNGLALGPDGAAYVCNRGPSSWVPMGELLLPNHAAPEPPGAQGCLQRVDLASGRVDTLFTHDAEGHPLRGPNDLAFDADGGLWFTDFGRLRPREMDRGCVYYVDPQRRQVVQASGPMLGPNGIAVLPGGRRLVVAETFSREASTFDIEAPGRLARHPGAEHGGRLLAAPAGPGYFDSLAVDVEGTVVVAMPLAAAVLVIAPDGGVSRIPMPDMAPTNVCFGGPDHRTLFVTLCTTGKVVTLPWTRPGLQLPFNAS